MVRKPPLVVVDADAIIAQANTADSNHKKALEVTKKLDRLNAEVIYPVTAVVEAVTVLQRKLNSGATAYGTAVAFVDPQAEVVEINQEVYSQAVNNYFSPRLSKKDTLFDCIVASVAEKYEAEAIFSFDKFYKKHGFKLASEL